MRGTLCHVCGHLHFDRVIFMNDLSSVPLLAQAEAEALKVAPQDLFARQFTISRSPSVPFERYRTSAIGAHFVHHCPRLDVHQIGRPDNSLGGLLLGIALDANGEAIGHDHTITPNHGQTWGAAVIEAALTWTGRFALLVADAAGTLLLTDTVGEMGVVFDPETGLAGSTLPLVLRRPIHPDPNFDHDMVRTGAGLYTLGFTRDIACRRLIPNHALDLETMRMTRIWPRDSAGWQTALKTPFEAAIDRLIAILRRNTLGFMKAKPSLFALSGGQDSRMLLGAVRDHAHLARTFFSMEHNWSSIRDCDTAERIAARLQLPYQRIKAPKPKPWEIKQFHARVGHCVNAGGTNTIRHAKMLEDGHLIIRGNVFGLTRANDWGTGKRPRRWNDIKFGAHRLKAGHAVTSEKTRSFLFPHYKAWRDALPPFLRERSHDLGFWEHYLPNSLGARNYAGARAQLVNPFANREAMMLVIAMDPALRKSGAVNRAILDRVAPDLDDIPFV